MHNYTSSFAHYYKAYTDFYADKEYNQCFFAKRDVLKTLEVFNQVEYQDDPYIGKLMAELDAIRDRMMVLRRE